MSPEDAVIVAASVAAIPPAATWLSARWRTRSGVITRHDQAMLDAYTRARGFDMETITNLQQRMAAAEARADAAERRANAAERRVALLERSMLLAGLTLPPETR